MHVCTLTDQDALAGLPYLGSNAGRARFDYLLPVGKSLAFMPPTITPPDDAPQVIAATDYAGPGFSLALAYAPLQATLEQDADRWRVFALNAALGFHGRDAFTVIGDRETPLAHYDRAHIRTSAELLGITRRSGATSTPTAPRAWRVTVANLTVDYRLAAEARADVDGALFVTVQPAAGQAQHFVALDFRLGDTHE